jgi:hypothetical protein
MMICLLNIDLSVIKNIIVKLFEIVNISIDNTFFITLVLGDCLAGRKL